MVKLAELLKLERPIVTIDTETTGVLKIDRIVSIAVTRHELNKNPVAWSSLVNPGIRIPPEVTKVHGITDEMVAGAPTWDKLAEPLTRKGLTSCDFCGQNVWFDLEVIRRECRRVNVDWDWERENQLVVDTSV